MGYWVCIRVIEATGRMYCGQTDNLECRLRQHNDPSHRGSMTTERFEEPWRLLWSRESSGRGEALKLERRIKKRATGSFLADLNWWCSAGGGVDPASSGIRSSAREPADTEEQVSLGLSSHKASCVHNTKLKFRSAPPVSGTMRSAS
jgi:predicted GIY-YIG superfamily endonuclease